MASSLVLRIGADLSNFQRSISQVENRLKRFSFRAERVGRDLTTRLTLPIVGVGAAAVSTFAKFDRMEKALAAVTGSAEAGAAQFERLFAIVNDPKTTLDLKGSATAAIQLQAVGQSARQTENLLKQLGIAATVSGSSAEDVGEVGRQLAQAAAKGKILQQELRIVLERIPALAAAIKDEFGTVTAEGLDEAGVSAQQFLDRLSGAIEGNEKFQSVQISLAKSIESFRANVQKSVADLGESIATSLNLTNVLDRMAAAIQNLTDRFTSLSPETQRFVVISAAAVAAVGPLSLGLGAAARSVVLLRSGFSLLLGPLSGAVGLLANATKVLSGYGNLLLRGGAIGRSIALARATTALRVAFLGLTGPIGIAVTAIGAVAAGVITAYRNSEFFRLQLAQLRQAFIPIISQVRILADKYLPDIGIEFKSIGSVFKGVLSALAGGVSFIVQGFIEVVETIKLTVGALQDIGNFRFQAASEKLAKSLFNPQSFVEAALRSKDAALKVFEQSQDGVIDNTAVGRSLAAAAIPDDPTALAAPSSTGARSVPAAIQQLPTENLERFAAFQLANIRITEQFEEQINSLKATLQEDFFGAYREGLDVITEKQKVFGESYDGLTEKINLTKQAITSLLEEGYDAQSDRVVLLTEQLRGYGEEKDKQRQKEEEEKESLSELESAASSAFSLVEQSMKNGANVVQAYGRAVVSAMRQAVSAKIKEAVVDAAKGALESVPFPLNIALAAGAGATASALFNGILGRINVPFLAKGGIVDQATLAVIGEAGPEVVMPLNKLQNFMQPQAAGLSGELRVQGDELVALIRTVMDQQRRMF